MRQISIYKTILVPAILLSLQSCFVAKEYSRPANAGQDESYRTDQLETDSTSMAEISWRELFTDPILRSHIEEALENNIDIRIALENVTIAEAYLKQGKAEMFPAISAELGGAYRKLTDSDQESYGTNSVEQYELSAHLSWEADIWGKIKSNKKALQASYLRSIAGHRAVKSDLVARLATLYYQLLALDEQLEITRQTISNRENSLETIKALKAAGNVTEVGVQQTAAQLYRAKAIAIDLQNEIRLLENTFSILLGVAPHAIPRSTLDTQEINTELQTGVPVMLLRNRPDIMAAEYNLIRSFQLTNVARSDFYPSLRISASTGFQALELSDLLDTNQLFASVAGSLTQPIFNRRQIKTNFEVAKSEQEIAYLDFRQYLLIASREVSDALFSLNTAQRKEEIKIKELQAYELATSYSEELLDSGFANYLEVLTARENFLNSQLELVNIKVNQLTAVVHLYEALGGGWK